VGLPGGGKVEIDKIMGTVAAVTAVGTGANLLIDRYMEKKNGEKTEDKEA
jgi:hypothetical protein